MGPVSGSQPNGDPYHGPVKGVNRGGGRAVPRAPMKAPAGRFSGTVEPMVEHRRPPASPSDPPAGAPLFDPVDPAQASAFDEGSWWSSRFATLLLDRIPMRKGLRVLDLGCGDGTTAVPAAQLGAEVLGVDVAANLVAAGNARAQALGLANIRFQEGDATDLNALDDESVDLVVSIFGAMFAPKPFDVASEMVRVTKPGGRIVMGNWIPNDPTLVAQILKISASYSPPPPEGFVSPMTWGMEDEVVERFGAAGIPKERISFQRNTYTFHYPGSPAELVADFRTYYGPTMNAFAAAEANGRADELQAELEQLFEAQNTSEDATSIPATFLRVTVQR